MKKTYVSPSAQLLDVLMSASLMATSPSTDEAFARRKNHTSHTSSQRSIWGEASGGLWSEG